MHHYAWLARYLRLFWIIGLLLIIVSIIIYFLSRETVALLAAPMLFVCLALAFRAQQLMQRGDFEHAGLCLYAMFIFSGFGQVLLVPASLPSAILGPPLAVISSVPFLSPQTLRWVIPVAGISIATLVLFSGYGGLIPSPLWVDRAALFIGGIVGSGLLVVLFKHYQDLLTASQQQLEELLSERTAEVREREELFQAVSELTSDFAFVMHIDANGRVTNSWENDTIVALTGYTAAALRAKGGFEAILHPTDRAQIIDFFHTLVKGQRGARDCRIAHANGTVRWLRTYAQPVWDQEVQRVTRIFGAMQDITASKEHQQQIAELAFFDSLTGLSNRRLFHDHLDAVLSLVSERPFAVLFLDLDYFKRVNDTLGHDMGDALLVQVAQRLQALVRPDDTLARLGGDEFAALLLNIAPEQALIIGQRLLNELEAPFQIHNHTLHIGASIGVASYPKDGDTISLLLKHADIAMYRAKIQGGQVVAYDETLFSLSQERLALEVDLRYAIGHDQLCLFFQPIHDLFTGELVRAEVLVRWQHPQRGLLLPAAFIHIAEECGLIRALDRWVLRKALQQCAAWHQAGTPLAININISAQLLADPTLIAEVQEIVAATRVQTRYVMVEITETAALHDLETTMCVLDQFKRLGMLIALDDFGTGYASLNRLKLLPVNVLKIDREFTAGIHQNPKDEGVLLAIAALADGLQLTTIVEGIETRAQYEWLREAGFAQGQGYLLGRPMPAKTLTPELATKSSLSL